MQRKREVSKKDLRGCQLFPEILFFSRAQCRASQTGVSISTPDTDTDTDIDTCTHLSWPHWHLALVKLTLMPTVFYIYIFTLIIQRHLFPTLERWHLNWHLLSTGTHLSWPYWHLALMCTVLYWQSYLQFSHLLTFYFQHFEYWHLYYNIVTLAFTLTFKPDTIKKDLPTLKKYYYQ